MVPRTLIVVAAVACKEPAKAPPPPPSPAPAAAMIDAVAVDAPLAIDASAAVNDAIDREIARRKPGSADHVLATWWKAAVNGQPQLHAGNAFVVELFVTPDVFAGQPCGNPYVTDVPRANDECLRRAIIEVPPPAWRAGWGCRGFSGTDLAKSVRADREAAKHVLRCGTTRDAAVFAAVDADGKVSTWLVNPLVTGSTPR